MTIISRNPLHVQIDGIDVITEPRPGDFKVTAIRGHRGHALQTIIAEEVDARLMTEIPDPEASLQKWARMFARRPQ